MPPPASQTSMATPPLGGRTPPLRAAAPPPPRDVLPRPPTSHPQREALEREAVDDPDEHRHLARPLGRRARHLERRLGRIADGEVRERDVLERADLLVALAVLGRER